MLVAPLLAAALSAAPRLAVMPIAAGDPASEKPASFLTETLAAELRQQSGAEVITSRDLGSMLSLEKQKQALGCTTDSCMAEIAGAAGADRLVAGDLGKLGESLVLQLRMIDARKARVIAQSRRRFKNGTLDDVLDALPGMTAELLRAAQAPGAQPAAATAPAAAAAPAPTAAPPPADAMVLHYRRRNGSYDSVRLHAWASSESAADRRKPHTSPVPRKAGASLVAPGLSHLPLVPPSGKDAFGAYWILPAAQYPGGRVNFVLATGGDWDECGVLDGRFWLAEDGREAWYVGPPDCQVTTDPAVARSLSGPR